VILFPVCLQLLCMLWLHGLVEKTEKLAATEAAASEVANHLTDMVSELVVYTRNISIKFDRGESRYVELAKNKEHILHTTGELHRILVSDKDLVITEELRNRMLAQLKATVNSLDKLSIGIERIEKVQVGNTGMVEKTAGDGSAWSDRRSSGGRPEGLNGCARRFDRVAKGNATCRNNCAL